MESDVRSGRAASQVQSSMPGTAPGRRLEDPHVDRPPFLADAPRPRPATAAADDAGDRLLEQMPGAALLLDGRGRIVAANTAAEHLLRAGDGLRSAAAADGRRLAATLPSQRGALQDCLSAAVPGDRDDGPLPGPRTCTRIDRVSGRQAYVLVASALTPSPAPRLLLRVLDPALAVRPDPRLLSAAFGFTGGEARVAALLASGLSTPQVAACLGVGVTTVRSQLAQCFEKTGLRSQVALATLLGSPLLRA